MKLRCDLVEIFILKSMVLTAIALKKSVRPLKNKKNAYLKSLELTVITDEYKFSRFFSIKLSCQLKFEIKL